jgi:hypothetical protein
MELRNRQCTRVLSCHRCERHSICGFARRKGARVVVRAAPPVPITIAISVSVVNVLCECHSVCIASANTFANFINVANCERKRVGIT